MDGTKAPPPQSPTAAAAAPRPPSRAPPGYDHVVSFNHNVKILVKDLVERFPRDTKVLRAQKLIACAIESVDYLSVIKAVGPYLYQYRDQVYALETDPAAAAFFMENDYDAELRGSVNETKAALVQYILPKVKESARALKPDELKEYKKLVVELLDDYVEYLGAVKLDARRAPPP